MLLLLLSPLIALYNFLLTVSAEECAEYMLYALFKGKKGWYRRDNMGNELGFENYTVSDTDKEAVWKHSLSVTDV